MTGSASIIYLLAYPSTVGLFTISACAAIVCNFKAKLYEHNGRGDIADVYRDRRDALVGLAVVFFVLGSIVAVAPLLG